MVVTSITDFVLFGTGTDIKPTTGIAPQTLFFEIDTGRVYKYTGGLWSLFSGDNKPETLTNKTITNPTITSFQNSGTITVPTGTRTLVGRDTTDTLLNKTLITPIIASVQNSGIITFPTGTRTLMARDTIDVLSNKTYNINSNTMTVNSQAAGDLLVNDGTKFIRLARGTNGQVLTSTASNIQWAAPSGGGGGLSASSPNTFTAVQTFNATMLALRNPANTFSATVDAGSQTGNRTFTYPVTTGNDTIELLTATQTPTNKTLGIDTNTFNHSTTNAAGDIIVNNGTRYIRLARGTANQVLTVNSGGTDIAWAAAQAGTGASTTVANTWTAVQTFNDTMFALRNPANTFSVTLGAGAQTAARTYTFPVTSGNDTIDLISAVQTLTNKSINVNSNPITATSQALGDILYNDGTSFTRLARGTTGQVLTATATSINWAAPTGGSSTVDTSYFQYTYFIYKSGSNFIAQTGNGLTAAQTSNASFATLLQNVINGISPAGTPTLIVFAPGDYVINSQITVPATRVGNITFKGSGDGMTRFLFGSGFNAASAGTTCFIFGSQLTIAAGNTGTPTADIATRANTITMSTTDVAKFVANDYVLIKSSKLFVSPATASSSALQGEIKRVQTAASSTLTIDIPTLDAYTVANTAKVYKLTYLSNITIEDITFAKDSGMSSSAPVNFVDFRYVNDLKLNRVELIDNVYQYDSGFTFFACLNTIVTNCAFFQTPSNAFNLQYALSFKAACQNVIVANCTSMGRFRHSFVMCDGIGGSITNEYAGLPRNIQCVNCTAIGAEVAAFDSHPDGEMIIFNNCQVLGTYTTYGINIRSKRTKAVNCTVHTASSRGIYVYENASECEIINCSAYNCGWYGLDFADGVSNIKVTGGYFSGNADDGIHVNANSDFIAFMNVSSINNVGYGINATDCINLTINSCPIFGNATGGINVAASARVLSNVLISGNHLAGQTSGSPIIVPAATIGVDSVIVKDNLGVAATIAGSTNFQGIQVDPIQKRSGAFVPSQGNSATSVGQADYMLAGAVTPTGGGTCNNTFDTTEGLLANLATAATTGSVAGLLASTVGVGIGRRAFSMRFKCRCKIDSTNSARLYFGVTSATALPISDTPLATTDHGVIVGFNTTDLTYQIYTCNGGGTVTKTAVTGAIAKNTNFHTMEINWAASGNATIIFDGVAQTVSATLPATTTNLFFNLLAHTNTITSRILSIKGVWIEADK